MIITFGDLAAITCVITLGAILQASTGLGAGLVIVPPLGLINLELVPGPVIFASLALSSLMAWQDRKSIKFLNLGTLVAGLIAVTALGALGQGYSRIAVLLISTLSAMFLIAKSA
jgi:uncharacterized protein